MKKEFVVERQGRSFVLYAGLLDMAHAKGLESIVTELVQAPTPENGLMAICHARVTIEEDRQFDGYGDAAPNNVGQGMQACLVRMAETRAKARALRDAVNIGTVAFEELEEGELPESGNRQRATGNSDYTVARSPLTGGTDAPSSLPVDGPKAQRVQLSGPITPAQKDALSSICRRVGIEPEGAALARYDLLLSNLTAGQAADLIRELQKGNTEAKAVEA
jgi:hypothetical protein